MQRVSFLTEDMPLDRAISEAWLIYQSDEIKEQKLIALNFLVYALDIKQSLNDQEKQERLIELMKEKATYEVIEPSYVPGKFPSFLPLNKIREKAWLEKALRQQKIVMVNEKDKAKDKKINRIHFNASQRAKYGVIISDGKFKQGGEIFNTDKFVSHRKAGYGAFTLSLLGELCIFPHLTGKDGVMHSSMCEERFFSHGDESNEDIFLLGAGEVKIRNGVLAEINIYSGHFKPRLGNLYYVLLYFESLGADISNTKIYLMHSPARADIKLSKTIIKIPKCKVLLMEEEKSYRLEKSKEVSNFYEIKAIDLLDEMKIKISANAKQFLSIIGFYADYQNCKTTFFKAKDKLLYSWRGESPTELRNQLAKSFRENCTHLLEGIENADSYVALDKAHTKLKKEINQLRVQNNLISQQFWKREDSGRLAREITKPKVKEIFTEFSNLKKSW